MGHSVCVRQFFVLISNMVSVFKYKAWLLNNETACTAYD